MIQRIRVAEKQYEIKRVYKKYPDSDEQKLVQIKNNLGYEALIKNDQFYFLCNEITDAEFTEILPETEQQVTETNNEELKLQEQINTQTN